MGSTLKIRKASIPWDALYGVPKHLQGASESADLFSEFTLPFAGEADLAQAATAFKVTQNDEAETGGGIAGEFEQKGAGGAGVRGSAQGTGSVGVTGSATDGVGAEFIATDSGDSVTRSVRLSDADPGSVQAGGTHALMQAWDAAAFATGALVAELTPEYLQLSGSLGVGKVSIGFDNTTIAYTAPANAGMIFVTSLPSTGVLHGTITLPAWPAERAGSMIFIRCTTTAASTTHSVDLIGPSGYNVNNSATAIQAIWNASALGEVVVFDGAHFWTLIRN